MLLSCPRANFKPLSKGQSHQLIVGQSVFNSTFNQKVNRSLLIKLYLFTRPSTQWGSNHQFYNFGATPLLTNLLESKNSKTKLKFHLLNSIKKYIIIVTKNRNDTSKYSYNKNFMSSLTLNCQLTLLMHQKGIHELY